MGSTVWSPGKRMSPARVLWPSFPLRYSHSLSKILLDSWSLSPRNKLPAGGIVGLIGAAWLRLATLAAVVATSIVMAGTIGAAFGYIVLRLVHRWKLDAKIASGPAVLALTDVAALSYYLGLSAVVLM